MTTNGPFETLAMLREELDAVDNRLVALIAERLSLCAKVGALKSRSGIQMMQSGRVLEVKRRASAIGAGYGLREQFIDTLYDLIIREACDLEERIIAKAEAAS